MSFLFILNLFNFLYLGDSGSYLIGFLCGYFLIDINSLNPLISPYFIALLLWYPAFENLFSIIRKIIKLDPLMQTIYIFTKYYFIFKRKKNNFIKNFSNPISALIIKLL